MGAFFKNQDGSATVMNVGILSAISFFVLSILTLSNIVALKIHTQKSADLSALSATQRLIYLKPGECSFAKRIADFNNVTLESCLVLSTYKTKITVYKNSIFGYKVKSTAIADK